MMLGENSPLLQDASATDTAATALAAAAEAEVFQRAVSALNGNHTNDTNNNTNTNYGANGSNISPSNNDTTNDGNDGIDNPTDDTLEFLTRTRHRLRALFFLFTCPIIPLATILTVLLFWVLYAALWGDDGGSCREPLRTFAGLSGFLFLYTPHHRRLKRYLIDRRNGNGRDTDGNAADRIYDHVYLTFCLAYVYLGVSWTENCHGGLPADAAADAACLSDDPFCNGCGCPHLYRVTRIYVLTLCVLATVLTLPLLCLPCVYLWIVRGAAADALEAAAAIAAGTGGAGRNDAAPPVYTVKQVLETMERVDGDVDVECGASTTAASDPNECCICMTDFRSKPGEIVVDEKIVIRTKCGHVFHKGCLAGWLGGHWGDDSTCGEDGVDLTRRCCPLCRKDLAPPAAASSSSI